MSTAWGELVMPNDLAAKLKGRNLEAVAMPLREKTLKTPTPKPQSDEGPRDIETDVEEELSELLAGFKGRAKDENRRFMLATDSEYWFAVCFQTREQKEAFLTAMQWIAQGDKYLDGQWVAKQLGVQLPPADLRYNTGKSDRKLNDLT